MATSSLSKLRAAVTSTIAVMLVGGIASGGAPFAFPVAPPGTPAGYVPQTSDTHGNVTYGPMTAGLLSPGTAGQVLQTNSTPAATWNTVTGDTTISASGVTTTASMSGTSAITAGSATDFRIYPVATPRIMALGDSQTAGSNGSYTGLVGGWPSYFVQQIRQWRGDFEMVASQAELPETSAGSSVVWNEGHPGDTIANLNTGWPTWTAATAFGGGPDIVVVMAGANDVSGGRSAAQMETDYTTLHASILATNASALIVDMCMPPFVAGTTVSTNLSAWNSTQSSFCTWMNGAFVPAHASSDVYSSCAQSLTPGDRLPDGVHPNQQGQSAIGTCVAQQLHSLMGMPRGATQTGLHDFRYRQPWASEQFITSSTDGLSLAGHSGVNPGSGSFTIAFDVMPTSLPGGTCSLVSYGSYAINNYYGILAVGSAIRVYWENTAITIGNTTGVTFSETALVPGKWLRVVVMADAAHGVVGLYVNGKLAGLNTAVGAWTNTQQTLTMGKDATFGCGVPGYYGRLWASKAVPGEPGGVAALRAVEADYYLGDSLIAGQASASFTLDGLLSDDVYAPGDPNPSFTVVGGATAAAAFPSATPLRPWEFDGRPLASYLYDSAGTVRAQLLSSSADFVAGGGANPAQSGLIRAANNETIVAARNAANSGDVPVIGTDSSNDVNIGDTVQTANMNFKINGSGSFGFYDTSLFLVANDISGLYPQVSGLGLGISTGAFGSTFLGAGNAGYTSFPAISGTHASQDNIDQFSCADVSTTNASFGPVNAQSYLLAAHHGLRLECHATARVVTAGSGGSFWTVTADHTYSCTQAASSGWTGTSQLGNNAWYGQCDCSGGLCTSVSAPVNPLITFSASITGSGTGTLQVAYSLYNDGSTTKPVTDILSCCRIEDD